MPLAVPHARLFRMLPCASGSQIWQSPCICCACFKQTKGSKMSSGLGVKGVSGWYHNSSGGRGLFDGWHAISEGCSWALVLNFGGEVVDDVDRSSSKQIIRHSIALYVAATHSLLNMTQISDISMESILCCRRLTPVEFTLGLPSRQQGNSRRARQFHLLTSRNLDQGAKAGGVHEACKSYQNLNPCSSHVINRRTWELSN